MGSIVLQVIIILTIPTLCWGAILNVNSQLGDDSTGTGTASAPLKTITRALSIASEGDTVRVEAGIDYDEVNGEVFPIVMKEGVDLQGTSEPNISESGMPVIRGGARIEIPTSPLGRYVSILCADDMAISGFVFNSINSSAGTSDGTSILCDSVSPTIQDNVFTGEGHAGVTTLGEAHPIIRDNEFSGDLAWGITAYGESYPQIESNEFSALNGIDSTDRSRPIIQGNTLSCRFVGISTKGWSDATIVDNTIEDNGEKGIYVRRDSTPSIQGNRIVDNPVGVWIRRGQVNPDLGGGGRSQGGNTFNNNALDLMNEADNNIMARYNLWSHSPCCESIDSEDIYDDEENPACGFVEFSPCEPCDLGPVPDETPIGESLYLIDCGPCPMCFEKFCDPRLNPGHDLFLVWDPETEVAETIDRGRLGLGVKDGPITAAAPMKWNAKSVFVGAVPSADGDAKDSGMVMFFDKAGNVISRIYGATAGERLGLDLDVRRNEVIAVSSQRVLRISGGEVVNSIPIATELRANSAAHIAFTDDVDGDKRPDILLGTPYADAGGLSEAGQIQVIGSQTGGVIDTLYGREPKQHLGRVLQSIDRTLQPKQMPSTMGRQD